MKKLRKVSNTDFNLGIVMKQMHIESNGLSWFNVETKTRKMVYDIMEPKLQAETEQRDELERLKKTVLDNHH